ncbi:MAG: transcriptional repressor NrdR [Oscillospiraceae bacterium]|nr:transcriptional repressor NrdR [Oscillospiraceae bacterium]
MKCPFCNFEDTKVIDSRPSEGKKRRRRECTQCGKRFTTYEIVEKPILMVSKKDGSFEPFDRAKLIAGITTATKKRAISLADIEDIVDSIENKMANEMRSEISTAEIGDSVLSALKDIDLVAYVRFASVYKDFNDLDSFIHIVSELDGK